MRPGYVTSPLWREIDRRDRIGRELRDRLAQALHVPPQEVAAIDRDEAQAMLIAIEAELGRNGLRP